MNLSRLLPLLLLFAGADALADDPFRVNLVKDLDTTPEIVDSEPHGFYAFNGRVYFTAFRQDTGYELFSTDGVSPTATLVADLLPGRAYGAPEILGSAGSRLILYSRIAEYTDNFQLSSFDPLTGQRTQLTAFAASESPGFYRLHDIGGRALLQGATDQSLWTTDGTVAGTARLLPGGVEIGVYREACRLGDRVLFTRRGAGGLEVWRSDGTAAGTQPVQALGESGTLVNARLTGGTCHFVIERSAGWAVWRTDGTGAGTSLVRESPDGRPHLLGPAGDKTYLFTTDSTGGQLWRLDQAQPLVTSPQMWFYAVAGGHAFYALPASGGRHVLVHDGSSAAPRTVTLGGTPLVLSEDIFPMLVTVGELLFARGNGGLYGIDPATATATRIAEGADAFFQFDPGLYSGGVAYGLGTAGKSGREVFRSDGTPGGTRLLHDIAKATHGAIEGGTAYVQRGDVLYFIASEFATSYWTRGLARSDGTDTGTQWLSRAVYGNNLSVADLREFGGGLAFSGFDPSTTSPSNALFHVDPSFAQTTPLLGSATAPIAFFGGENLLVYNCNTTASNTSRVCALRPGDSQSTQISSIPYYGSPFTPLDIVGDSMVYFDHGQVWRTDGTVPGTYVLANLMPWQHDQALPMSPLPSVQRLVHGGRLHFQACTAQAQSACGVYATDGTASPVLLAGVSDYVTAYATYQGQLVFATDGTSTGRLWTSGGTPQTTRSVATIAHYAYYLTEAGGLLHFIGWNGASYGYFVTDATAAGTRQVPLPIAFDGSEVWEFDGDVAFSCGGTCIVDGAGTGLKQRITMPENRGFMARLGGSLLFRGNDEFHGTELWRLSHDTDAIFADGFDD